MTKERFFEIAEEAGLRTVYEREVCWRHWNKLGCRYEDTARFYTGGFPSTLPGIAASLRGTLGGFWNALRGILGLRRAERG